MWKRILLITILLILIVILARILYGVATAPPLGSHFPQKLKPPSVGIDILIAGDLVLDNGCLRVSSIDGNSFLIIWDPRFSTRTDQGIVQVIDNSTGDLLASVGDLVVVSDGGDLPDPTWMWLKRPIPHECLGPYWVVGETIEKFERPSLGDHFPQQNITQGDTLETTLKGDLTLENGCLRINNTEIGSFLLVWDLRFSTRREQENLQVIDSRTGKVVISAGDFTEIGGRVIEDPMRVQLRESIPEECLGPYFRVGFGESIKKIDKP